MPAPPPQTRYPFDLIAVDLDGTLLNSRHEVPPEHRAALHRAHEAGMKIVLCTGRAHAETLPILRQIGLDLDATVTSFGAIVTDIPSGKTIACDPIARDVAEDLSRWLLERGQTVLWLVDRDRAGFDGYDLPGMTRHPAVDRWIARTECDIRVAATLSDAAHDPVRVSIIDEPPALDAVSAELAREFSERIRHNLLRAPAYGFSVIEAFAPHVNKWYGIERVCRRWSIDPARALAFGDDVNDVDLVRHAGLGVAMANAHPATRAAAQRVTTSNDEGGVARVIDEVLRGGA